MSSLSSESGSGPAGGLPVNFEESNKVVCVKCKEKEPFGFTQATGSRNPNIRCCLACGATDKALSRNPAGRSVNNKRSAEERVQYYKDRKRARENSDTGYMDRSDIATAVQYGEESYQDDAEEIFDDFIPYSKFERRLLKMDWEVEDIEKEWKKRLSDPKTGQ